MNIKKFTLILALVFLSSLSFAEGLQLFSDDKLILMRNSKSGIQQLLSQAKENIEKDPESYEYNWQYAGVLYFYGDFYLSDRKSRKYYFNQSRQYARKATELNPGGVEGHFLLGVASALWAESNGVLQSLFMADDVAREMTKVIKIDPAFYQGIPWAIRAQVYGLAPGRPISVGNHEKAYSDFLMAHKYNKNYRVVYQLNAYMLIQHKKWAEAEEMIKKGRALPLDSNRPWEEKLAFSVFDRYQKTIDENKQ